MATGVYSLNTLNDNWFEDRLQPAGSLTATGSIESAVARGYETDLAYIGEKYDVLARISRIPPKESYATPDDGFKEKATTNLSDYPNPRDRPEYSKDKTTTPAIVNQKNAPVKPPEKRALPGPSSGFGATISRHKEGHDVRFWNTTTRDFFGQGFGTRSQPRLDPAALQPAGYSTEKEEGKTEGVKVGRLCGEYFTESSDPGSDTRTQRSWLYSGDAALKNAHLGGTRPAVPELDNELSVSIGKGAMSKVRNDLKARKGRLYLTATNITNGVGNRDVMAVYQDDLK